MYRIEDKNGNIAIIKSLSSELWLLFFGVFFSSVLASICFWLANGDKAPLIFGSVFGVVALLLLFSLPNHYKKLKKHNGLILLKANDKGVHLYNTPTNSPYHYRWHEIDKIYLTNSYRYHDSDGYSREKNILLVLLKGKDNFSFMEKSKRGLFLSPNNQLMTTLNFPKDQQNKIKDKLLIASKHQVTIESYHRINFDFIKSTCQFIPLSTAF